MQCLLYHRTRFFDRQHNRRAREIAAFEPLAQIFHCAALCPVHLQDLVSLVQLAADEGRAANYLPNERTAWLRSPGAECRKPHMSQGPYRFGKRILRAPVTVRRLRQRQLQPTTVTGPTCLSHSNFFPALAPCCRSCWRPASRPQSTGTQTPSKTSLVTGCPRSAVDRRQQSARERTRRRESDTGATGGPVSTFKTSLCDSSRTARASRTQPLSTSLCSAAIAGVSTTRGGAGGSAIAGVSSAPSMAGRGGA